MAQLVIQACDAACRLVELLQQESAVACYQERDVTGTASRVVLEAHPSLIIRRELWEQAYGFGAREGDHDESLDSTWEAWPVEMRGHILRFDDEILAIVDTGLPAR
jgi:hypothetical protein